MKVQLQLGLLWLTGAIAGISIAPAQISEVVLHDFTPPANGANPFAGLIRDPAGNLFGTSGSGGAQNAGAVFEVNTSGQLTVLYSFTGGLDGSGPRGALMRDSTGNLYGTTESGGSAGAGVVFKLDPSGQLTVLYSFTGGADGASPFAGVVQDPAGNLYGTTAYGGSAQLSAGYGVVYRLSPAGLLTVMHTFTGAPDGAYPFAGVILDAGSLYGTTYVGGSSNAGLVYQVDGVNTETVLYNFTGGTDGANPYAGVIRNSAGEIYGTTYYGGVAGYGVVYKLGRAGHEKVIYSFSGGMDGANPYAGVIRDSAGYFYGTTLYGGASRAGVVYKLDTASNESVLYGFTGAAGGANPYAGVIHDSSGNLYGVAAYGGASGLGTVFKVDPAGRQTVLFGFPEAIGGFAPGSSLLLDGTGNLYGTAPQGGALGEGVVYKIGRHGHETVLHSFGGTDGSGPGSGLVGDAAGNLYGTTFNGGAAGYGAVYKIDSAGNETVLYSFTGGADGSNPYGGVVLDAAGNLYGTTWYGGSGEGGVIFKIDITGHATVLYKFTSAPGASRSYSTLARDPAGNLYGTAYAGGTAGVGAVYKLDTSHTFTVLYNFTGGNDGQFPYAGVILDAAGNLYGTTELGGAPYAGVIYMVSASGQFTVLYAFTGGADGDFPNGGLTRDSAGNLYGTTNYGGANGAGVVYKLDAANNLTVLYSFTGAADGANPNAAVIRDASGSLYGTTLSGGAGSVGTVFKLKGVQ